MIGLAVALAATWLYLRYKGQRKAAILAAKSTLVAAAWEKHAAALVRLDWAALATMYHPEAVLVVSVLGEVINSLLCFTNRNMLSSTRGFQQQNFRCKCCNNTLVIKLVIGLLITYMQRDPDRCVDVLNYQGTSNE